MLSKLDAGSNFHVRHYLGLFQLTITEYVWGIFEMDWHKITRPVGLHLFIDNTQKGHVTEPQG